MRVILEHGVAVMEFVGLLPMCTVHLPRLSQVEMKKEVSAKVLTGCGRWE
jgi:hypothetical protein